MGAHSIKVIQQIPVSLATAWDFFSNPANLHTITPGNMGFRTISRYHGKVMYPGQIIEYTVKPFGIPMYWMTEITHVKEREYFIDEQRSGPYRLWHHQHHFRTIDAGVEMTDIVHYRNPFGVIGRLANGLFVRNKLRSIFEYRIARTAELFGRIEGQVVEIAMV